MKAILIAMLLGSDPWPVLEKADPWPVADEKPPHVVVLTAGWCGPCESWKSGERMKLLEAGWRIKVVDIDEQPDEAAKWGIAGLPKFVRVGKDGSPSKTWSGFLGLTEFGNWFYDKEPAVVQPQAVAVQYVQPKRGRRQFLGGLIRW